MFIKHRAGEYFVHCKTERQMSPTISRRTFWSLAKSIFRSFQSSNFPSICSSSDDLVCESHEKADIFDYPFDSNSTLIDYSTSLAYCSPVSLALVPRRPTRLIHPNGILLTVRKMCPSWLVSYTAFPVFLSKFVNDFENKPFLNVVTRVTLRIIPKFPLRGYLGSIWNYHLYRTALASRTSDYGAIDNMNSDLVALLATCLPLSHSWLISLGNYRGGHLVSFNSLELPTEFGKVFFRCSDSSWPSNRRYHGSSVSQPSPSELTR